MILGEACCHNCERVIGAGLEQSLLHKITGLFAALRLRMNYKSKRPKDRPPSLPYTIIAKDGTRRTIEIPAKKVPRHWTVHVTETLPGVIVGRTRDAEAKISVVTQCLKSDFANIANRGESVQFPAAVNARDFARFIAKMAHAMAVASYGIDAFEPWLPEFILNKDNCSFHYYVSGHLGDVVDAKGDHSISLGTWEGDGLRISARVQLFCCFAAAYYMVAVGKFKEQ